MAYKDIQIEYELDLTDLEELEPDELLDAIKALNPISIDHSFDMTEIDDDELMNEVYDRISDLKYELIELVETHYGYRRFEIDETSTVEQMKADYILEIFDKYTLEEIEKALPK